MVDKRKSLSKQTFNRGDNFTGQLQPAENKQGKEFQLG